MRPRIRTIKPEVHSHELLWDKEQETGLPLFRGFTGLWAYADREGRFEWRPRRLKHAILPYWNGDFADVLDALADAKFILRYEVDGKEYGYLPTFLKHQAVNNREEESKIPAHPDENVTRAPRVTVACPTRAPRVPHATEGEGKGTERNGKEGGGNTRDSRVSCIPPSFSDSESRSRRAKDCCGLSEQDWSRVVPSWEYELVAWTDALKVFFQTAAIPVPVTKRACFPLLEALANGWELETICSTLRNTIPDEFQSKQSPAWIMQHLGQLQEKDPKMAPPSKREVIRL